MTQTGGRALTPKTNPMPVNVLIDGPHQVGEKTLFRVTLCHPEKGPFGREYAVQEELLALDLAERMARDRKLPLLDRRTTKGE